VERSQGDETIKVQIIRKYVPEAFAPHRSSTRNSQDKEQVTPKIDFING